MIVHKDKCPMCDEEFIINDLRNPPTTCGSHMCVVNYRYQQKRSDPKTHEKISPDKIKKWEWK